MPKRNKPEQDENPADSERPWTEAQWEQEFRRSDARADRFGELLETFIDHPDRDEIVAREMGWNELADDLVEFKRAAELEEDEDEDDEGEFDAEADDDGDEPAAADEENLFGDDDDDGVSSIPAYVMARDLGEKLHKLLEPYLSGSPDDDDPSDGRFGEAYIGPMIAAAKISGGHAMGYHDDILCGNIVKNKIGLEAVEKSIAAYKSLKADGLLPAELVDSVLPEIEELRAAINQRIAELRAKVWW